MKKFCYRVQKGETLYSLSSRFSVSVFEIIKENRLKADVEEGDILVISLSSSRVYEVLPHEDIFVISKKLGVDEERLLSLNGNPEYVFYGVLLNY